VTLVQREASSEGAGQLVGWLAGRLADLLAALHDRAYHEQSALVGAGWLAAVACRESVG